MKALEEQIEGITRTLCEKTGLYLLETELRGSKGNRMIRVVVDTESGITLNETTSLARQLNDEFEKQMILPEGYRLEVTSPGLNRSLQFLWQYRRNVGRKLWVVYYLDEERCEFTGELVEVSDSEIVLKSKEKEKNIPLKSIRTAKVQF